MRQSAHTMKRQAEKRRGRPGGVKSMKAMRIGTMTRQLFESYEVRYGCARTRPRGELPEPRERQMSMFATSRVRAALMLCHGLSEVGALAVRLASLWAPQDRDGWISMRVPRAPKDDASRSGLFPSEFSPYRAIIDGICHLQLSSECASAFNNLLIWPHVAQTLSQMRSRPRP